MIIDIYIDNTKLDIFKDESIELNSSVANINDITKNTTEYTKSFTVPSSHTNNTTFKHYYNANIDNTFDARTKVDGRIEINGIPFKFGKWKLEKVNVKQGRPSSYTINFRGNLISLKEKFKEDEMSGLDLSAYNHFYTYDNVYSGLTGNLFSGDVIYNLFSKKRYYYNSINTDNTQTDTIANIAWGGGSNVGVKWNDLKPSIRIQRVIEAIETKYNITFSPDFFNRSEFKDLFIWLNADTSIQGRPTEQLINWDIGTPQYGLSFATDTWTNTQTAFDNFRYRIDVLPTLPNIAYKVIVKNFGVPVAEFNCDGGDFSGEIILVPLVNATNTPFEYTFYISSSNTIEYEAKLLIRKSFGAFGDMNVRSSARFLLDEFDISANLPRMKVIDFLNGLSKMYKLIIIADQYNNIYVNTLNDYYAQGKVYDFTEYVDFSSYDVERGNILSQIKFNFETPTTILNNQFKLNTGVSYGDEELVLEDAQGEILDGDSLEVKLPFEQIVYERLTDVQGNALTNVVYGGIFDAALEPVNPKMHLFYNQLQSLAGSPISLLNASDVKVNISDINIPLHTYGQINPQYSTVFGKEFSEWDGLLITNTLYSNYYQNYVNSIFNIKRRNFKFNCKNIPLRILTKLQLNDVLFIKNNYYRIDNYNFNLLTGETTLNLINNFDSLIGNMSVDKKQIFVDFNAQSRTIYINNVTDFEPDIKEPVMIEVEKVGNLITVDIFENTSSQDRVTILGLKDIATGQEIDVLIYQTCQAMTFDNSERTFDSNTITFDSE